MNIKWNWGTGILLAIVLFMLFIILLVFFTMRQNFDLVEKDYYPKALEYQQQIDKEQNARKLAKKVEINNSGDYLEITFQSFFKPNEVKGKIIFYKPSDKNGDIKEDIKLDTAGCQKFPINLLQKGKYILKIDYQVEGVAYFQEETVFI